MTSRTERGPDDRTTVVIATRDRRDELLGTLTMLAELPERPPIVVVDNASTDGTADAVRASFPAVRLVVLDRNRGAPARNVGVMAAVTDYVAFADDDSWWAPGALRRAADHLDASPRLAVLQARILVGTSERTDPTCAGMATSPLPPAPDLPGPPLLGFIACGAVVRRDAFLGVGGFDEVLFFCGEEQLVAQDLVARGWGLAYVDDVIAHHHPSGDRDATARRRRVARNDLLAVWMRRRWATIASRTARCLRSSLRDPAVRGGVIDAAIRLPRVLGRRRRLPSEVEELLSRLDREA